VTDGQLALEWAHLWAKVAARDPDWLARLAPYDAPESTPPHPMLDVVPGPVADWERAPRPEGMP